MTVDADDGPLLAVDGLAVEFGTGASRQRVVDGISLSIRRGEILALVGESGSGKSLTAMSIMGLLPSGARIAAGAIRLDGADLVSLPPAALDGIRGRRIGMLFQQPQAMLDPTGRVGDQVVESLRRHRGVGRAAARERAVELLRDVGIAEPALRARAFSFELSGGMAQRAMMAAALSADPELLIADEPTTALDVTVQAQILRLIDEQRWRRNLAVLLITHDLSIVSALADSVAVMYAGRIVEQGPTARVFTSPRHPYTQALMRCSLLESDEAGVLASIPGSIASTRDLGAGCRFHPRCGLARSGDFIDRCAASEPELRAVDTECRVRCWAADPGPGAGGHARAG